MKNYQFVDGIGKKISINPFLFRIVFKIFNIPHLGGRFRFYVLKNILHSLPLKSNNLALDVGSGYGFNSLALYDARLKVTAVDKDTRRLTIAKKIASSLDKNISFQKEDLYQMPFKNNSFDICICFEVLEHLKNPQKALLEMARVLKPKGILIISYPNELSITNQKLYRLSGHSKEGFTQKEISILTKKANFKSKYPSIGYGKTILGISVIFLNTYAIFISPYLAGALSPIFDFLLRIDVLMPFGTPAGIIEVLEKKAVVD